MERGVGGVRGEDGAQGVVEYGGRGVGGEGGGGGGGDEGGNGRRRGVEGKAEVRRGWWAEGGVGGKDGGKGGEDGGRGVGWGEEDGGGGLRGEQGLYLTLHWHRITRVTAWRWAMCQPF